MARLRLDIDFKTALGEADHLLLAGCARALRRAPWKSLSRAGWTRQLARLTAELVARGAGAAGSGAWATTLTSGTGPARASVVALPDESSRSLSPSGSHALAATLAKANLPEEGRILVLLVLEDPEHLLPLALALSRIAPRFDRRSGKHGRTLDVVAVTRDGEIVDADKTVRGTVSAARWAADMVDRPAEDLTTEDFADEARSLFGRLRSVGARLLVGDELVEAGLNGIHAVGRAAMVAPRLLVLERDAPEASRTIALVGKGIVYDTGGLALKGREGMTAMKSDMGGAAAVVGAFSVLARERLGVRLTCVVPLAENAIGPASYRHGDILSMHSGKSVEINNTDAEGRILLHDAVSYAARELGASLVIDAATLTGAQGVATGKVHAAVASDSEELERAAVAAGLATGDVVYPVLYAPELHAGEFRSEVADMRNSVRDRRNAQVGCAAWFVHQGLAGTKADWLHVDLASPAFPDERATGFGVALLAELVRRLAG